MLPTQSANSETSVALRSLPVISTVVRPTIATADEVTNPRSSSKAVSSEILRRSCTRLLVHVHSSRPIFRVEQYGLSGYLAELAARPAFRVALVGGGDGVHAAHEYIAELAQQRGVAVRAFVDQASAVAWLERDVGQPPRRAPAALKDLQLK